MGRVSPFAVSVFAICFAACSEKSPAGTGAGGSGGGAAGAGGSAGAAGGASGTSAGGRGGAGGGNAGGRGGAGGGQGGAAGACAEPSPCEGYDNRPDAGVTAVITCLSPSVAPANTRLTLTIYGHHLAIGAGNPAIVTVGPSSTPLNGVPQSACHLTVDVPASEVATPRQAAVVVDPGGWVRTSLATTLTIQ
jgi:hypothetical protein